MKFICFSLLSGLIFQCSVLAQDNTILGNTGIFPPQHIGKQNASAEVQSAKESQFRPLQQITSRYINLVDRKIDKYGKRIIFKTEKTLVRLSNWENKIRQLLLSANPEAAHRLFENNQLTFASALEKFRNGESIIAEQQARYDEYRDKLTGRIKFLEDQKDQLNAKLVQPLKDAHRKLESLENQQARVEATAQFIKERKKQLIAQCLQYIGSSKYFLKMEKENYYYAETLKNYKEIFADQSKAEQLAVHVLNKVPGFQKFIQQNSILASMFGQSSGTGTEADVAGLQTRVSIDQSIQSQLIAGGSGARGVLQQNIQVAQGQLTSLKDKVLKAGGSSNSDTEIPDFKPATTRSKTFKQRIEFGANVQASKSNSLLPVTEDIALHAGYQLTDKSVVGLGVGYKVGLGTLNHISISHQGAGIRSYIDWKLKKQFYFTGGFEFNYNAGFKNIEALKVYNNWQSSGLFGLSKKINLTNKWFKGTKLSLLYDALAKRHTPVSQSFLFRVGYNFK